MTLVILPSLIHLIPCQKDGVMTQPIKSLLLDHEELNPDPHYLFKKSATVVCTSDPKIGVHREGPQGFAGLPV